MDLLTQFKNFTIDRLSFDEIFTLIAYGKSIRAEYEARSMPSPEWLTDGLRRLGRRADSMKHDEMERRLAELKRQRAADLTPTERRERADAEIKQLEAELNASALPVATKA